MKYKKHVSVTMNRSGFFDHGPIYWLNQNVGIYEREMFDGHRGEGWYARVIYGTGGSASLDVAFVKEEDALAFMLRWQ